MAVARMIRRAQSVQATRNGYFGGYISKRQKCGKFEAKKCMQKMHALRIRQVGKTEHQQQRAVSGRMLTEIEMNGTLRGAVEEANLCINLNPHDVLFAECVRTLATETLDFSPWFQR